MTDDAWYFVMLIVLFLLVFLVMGRSAQPAPANPLAVHVARVEAGAYGSPDRADIQARLQLMKAALAAGHKVRECRLTAYYPHCGYAGGGWQTALGDHLPDTGIVASATRHFRFWRNATLWIEGIGVVRVRDNGPGWRSLYQFDWCAPTCATARAFAHGCRRAFVVLDVEHEQRLNKREGAQQ